MYQIKIVADFDDDGIPVKELEYELSDLLEDHGYTNVGVLIEDERDAWDYKGV